MKIKKDNKKRQELSINEEMNLLSEKLEKLKSSKLDCLSRTYLAKFFLDKAMLSWASSKSPSSMITG